MTATIGPTAPPSPPPAPLFLLSIDVAAGRVAVHGDLDREHSERFLDAARLLAFSRSPGWSIDVSAVTFCDAGGLCALLVARKLAHRSGRTFRVTRAGPWMRRLLPMVGLEATDTTSRSLRPVR
jgi:anti-anti-sigma regulatory factor